MRTVCLFVGICMLVSCGGTVKETSQKQEVKFASVQTVAEENERSYTFLSSPYRTTELSFRVGGPVVNFEVQNGQFFRKGELIAAIDDRDFLIRKQRAEALFNQTKADFIRVSNLYEKGNISGAVYEKAKADYERAEADFNTAENELKDTRLTAPFDGYVQKINIDKYQEVSPSFPVVTFIDLSRIKAEACIPEDMAVGLRAAGLKDSSFVQFKALGEKKFHPIETYVTQSTLENNISYLYTVILDNKDYSLFGGMAGTLSLRFPKSDGGLHSCSLVAIPQTAVCHTIDRGAFVWVLGKDSRVRKQKVEIGNMLSGNRVEILSGLNVGDKVAVTRLSYLSENEEVLLQL